MENDKILEMLDAEIVKLLGKLSKLNPGTDDYKKVRAELNYLHRMRSEEIKRVSGILERDLKVQQMEDIRDQNNNEYALKKAKFEAEKELGEFERDLKSKSYEDQKDSEKDKKKRERIDKIASHTVRVFEVLVPIVAYNAWFNRGLQFETEGAFTSTTFRNLLGKAKNR